MNLISKNYISVGLIILLFATACKNNSTKENATNEKTEAGTNETSSSKDLQITFSAAQYKLASIETGAIEKRNLSHIIKVNGVVDVEPKSTAMVSAPLGGYIRTAGMLPGEYVEKGQVLAVIENPDFIKMQQEYLESVAGMQYLEEEFQRQKKLREEDVNAAKTFQKVSSDYKVMQAKIKGLEQRLDLAGINLATLKAGKITQTANLYAPISGYIKTSNVTIGKYVTPTDVLFEIVNTDDLHLALNAFEKDMGKIQKGQTVKFSLANENNFNRTATVFLVGKSMEGDHVVPVYCHLKEGSSSGLLPGVYVKAWIETNAEEQFAVPTEAIVQLEGKDYLVVQSDSSSTGYTFDFKQIKKGIEEGGYTAVMLPENLDTQKADVVIKNAYTVLSALRKSEESE